MPEQSYWESLFDVACILDAFDIGPRTGATVELGCGFGTFTIPVAQRTGAVVHACDIDPEMIATTRRRALALGLSQIRTELRDVFSDDFGLPDASCGACLLCNILHGEHPVMMLREAARVTRPGGVVAVIHWRSDIATPRGPGLAIRPRPDQILSWAGEVSELSADEPAVVFPPWHFGVVLRKR